MTLRSMFTVLSVLAGSVTALAADNPAPTVPDRSATRIGPADCVVSAVDARTRIERANLPAAGPIDGFGLDVRRQQATTDGNCKAVDDSAVGEVE